MATSPNYDAYLPLANKFVDFVNESVTAYHAVATSKKMLLDAGFVQISEKDQWKLQPKGKYFFTRNQSTIVAFTIGGKYKSGNGFNIVGAHTDSPHLQLKPKVSAQREGYLQVGVQPYGGGLWPTWFDRDLGIAGRVIVKNNDNNNYESKLVRIDKPIVRIPTLAIHLNRESDIKLEFNKQEHLLPIIAMQQSIDSQLNTNNILLNLLSNQLNCNVNDIRDYELGLYDINKSIIGGVYNEFIYSARIDNLMMSFCSLYSLIQSSSSSSSLDNETNINVSILFDNEEIGSSTAHGAASPIVNDIIHRITLSSSSFDNQSSSSSIPSHDLFQIAIRNSFLISADMAHAVHPNWSEKHETNHKPRIHMGVVLKHNANQRYATIATTAFVIRELASRSNIPVQDFVVRNDSLCGSTIGPIVASGTGIRTVDIGIPQLSMHSIREMCGVSDVTHSINLLTSFYNNFSSIDKSLKID